MDAFWAQGYEGTSLSDLIEVTGIQKGSIYKAFGDKRSLFLRALDRYVEENLRAMERAIDEAGEDPRAALEAALGGMVSRLTGESNRQRGCLAVNSVMEMARRDEDVASRLRGLFEGQTALIEPVIVRGQEAGVFRTQSAGELAAMLVALVPGVVGGAKVGADESASRRLMDVGLSLIGRNGG